MSLTAERVTSRPAMFPACQGSCGWTAASAAVAVLAFLPVAALVAIAASGSGELWSHLATSVIPQASLTTVLLLAGVGAMVIVIGTGTAWLVAAHEFPGRRVLDWALLLPLAVPTYIVAYAYLDILHPIGPVQSAFRAVLGVEHPRDLRLPDIRSLGGAIILLGLVLYPYVYLPARALFLMQAAGVMEAARTLGSGPRSVFFRVALPLARPAVAVGTSLALMETLNDIGASEFLGIQTLTRSVYSTWVNQSNLAGAAQIALVMLAVVVLLVVVERWARRRQRFAAATLRSGRMQPRPLSGAAGWTATVAASLPVLLGFVLPATYLVDQAARRIDFAGLSDKILGEALNTVAVSAAGTAVAVLCGLVVTYAARLDRGPFAGAALRAASLGYALPGTVLAIGVLIPLAAFDNAVDDVVRSAFGISTGLLLSGSAAILVYAYVVRFLAVASGGTESGLAKVPRSLDYSARTLGRTATGAFRDVHLPMIRPAVGAAAILVFVDCMKELPATLLLRPLNFETLATHLYGEASRGTYEDGAVAALAIVLVGLIPVLLLGRLGRPAMPEASSALR